MTEPELALSIQHRFTARGDASEPTWRMAAPSGKLAAGSYRSAGEIRPAVVVEMAALKTS